MDKKNVWVISEFGEPDYTPDFEFPEVINHTRVFENFEDARDAIFQILKDFCSDHYEEYFDDNGRLFMIENYLEDELEDELFEDDELFQSFTKEEYEEYKKEAKLRVEHWKPVFDTLAELFTGETIRKEYKILLPVITGADTTNYSIACWTEDGVLCIHSVDDGSCNGYEPYIHTNMFDMTDSDKDYFMTFELRFPDIDWSRIWNFSLRKVTIE